MPAPDYFAITLYVRDRSAKAEKTHERLSQLCFRYLPGRHVLTVADLSTLGDKGDNYRVGSTPGTLSALPVPIASFIQDLAFDEDFYIFVEKGE